MVSFDPIIEEFFKQAVVYLVPIVSILTAAFFAYLYKKLKNNPIIKSLLQDVDSMNTKEVTEAFYFYNGSYHKLMQVFLQAVEDDKITPEELYKVLKQLEEIRQLHDELIKKIEETKK